MSDELDDAIIAYLTGSIDDVAFEALDQQLKRDPTAARRFAEICDRDRELAAILRMQEPHSKSTRVRSARRRKPRVSIIRYASAAAVVLAVVGLLWLNFRNRSTTSGSAEEVATVKSVDGLVTLQSPGSGVASAIASGADLRHGDAIHVPERGSLIFSYRDGTTVSADAVTDLTITPAQNKKVLLARGSLSAEVTPQPTQSPMQLMTPHAQADVVGTQLRITLREENTTLSVTTGRVRFTRNIDRQSLVVESGYSATASLTNELPLIQRTLKSLRDDLPKNAKLQFHVAFADRPAHWGGEYATPPESPAGSLAIGSNQFQPETRFYGEIRSPFFETGLAAGPTTYLRFRYHTESFKSGDLIKLMLKKKDGSIFHGFVRPDYNKWSVATLRMDREFLDLENGAHPLTARDAIHNIVFLGAAPDGKKAFQGPRIWIDEVLVFNSLENIDVLKVQQ